MKNKILLGILIGWVILDAIMIWGVGGSIAPYFWNASIFVVGPAAILGTIVALVCLIRSACKKKSVIWNIVFVISFAVLAIPSATIFGKSLVTYPDKEKDVMVMMKPVKDAVYKGGKDFKTHSLWPSERYAYDVVREPYSTGSKRLTDYGIYGADVVAPVSGTVIALNNDEKDVEPGCSEFTSSEGNYIYLKIDHSDSYLLLAHLQKGSVKVQVGDHIEAGKLIANVGNSGTTSEPHLHIQRQRNDPTKMKLAVCAEGLPMNLR